MLLHTAMCQNELFSSARREKKGKHFGDNLPLSISKDLCSFTASMQPHERDEYLAFPPHQQAHQSRNTNHQTRGKGQT